MFEKQQFSTVAPCAFLGNLQQDLQCETTVLEKALCPGAGAAESVSDLPVLILVISSHSPKNRYFHGK